MRIAMVEPWVYMSLALHLLWNVHNTDDFKLVGVLSVVATGISAVLQVLLVQERGAVDDDEHGWVMGSSLVPLLMTSLWMAMSPSTTLANSSNMIPLYTVLTCSVGLALSLSFLCHVMFTTRHDKKAQFNTPTKWNILGMQSLIVPLVISYHSIYQQQEQWHDSPMKSSIHQMNSIVSIVYIGMQTMFWSILYPGPSCVPEKADSQQQKQGRPMVTLGECAVLSNLGSIVVTDYVIRYIAGYAYCESLSSSTTTRPYYWVASQAGLLGCLGGCTLATVIWNPYSRNGKLLWKRHSLWMGAELLWIAVLVAGITCVFLEWAFYCEDKYDCMKTNVGDATTMEFHRNGSWRWQSSFLWWLISFLCETEGSVPRYWWLLYWMIVLVVAMGLAVAWLRRRRRRDTLHPSPFSVVVARKWFHGVAVALFWPVTYTAPHLMSLSYAIATALLLLMECLRILPSHSLHANPTRTITTTHRHHQHVQGTSVTLNGTLNDFYTAFLDDAKDGGGGGPVWSHLALIVGCAAPLWIDEWLLWSTTSSTATTFRLLPFVGILVLGVGDAAGAVVGVYWGRHGWPQSRRTMEGSLAMFVTMYLFVLVLGGDTMKLMRNITLFATLLRLTLLEASTSQIDNLCLPLVGVTSLLLHQR